MASLDDAVVARAVAESAHQLLEAPQEFNPLMDMVGDACFVLIGEASHGTHEFYEYRARLTKRLITEKQFSAVAVEADWPDAYRVNRYVRGVGADEEAVEALADFQRFPAWMWRNADVLEFVDWLRTHNEKRGYQQRAGFYGLDLYSLRRSMEAVVSYLDEVDPEAARRARLRYSCFDHFGEDPQAYGYSTTFGMTESCEAEVVSELIELQRSQDQMFQGHILSWNLRDQHMTDTLDALASHLQKQVGPAKMVVWAHNSHVGDARATDMGRAGEVTIGQLTRERHPGECVLIGFSTYTGTVTAASDWGGPAEHKRVRRGLPDSYEQLFHRAGLPSFLLNLRELGEAAGGLRQPRLQRAIGVIYRPETERASHYLHSRLPEQFDALMHIDETRALEPLERTALWEKGEAPETFPTGI